MFKESPMQKAGVQCVDCHMPKIGYRSDGFGEFQEAQSDLSGGSVPGHIESAKPPTTSEQLQSVPDRMLVQLALQRPPMHAERPRGGRNIAVVFHQHAINMLPFHAIHRRRFLADRRGMVA